VELDALSYGPRDVQVDDDIEGASVVARGFVLVLRGSEVNSHTLDVLAAHTSQAL
jgi:hypothetical protein